MERVCMLLLLLLAASKTQLDDTISDVTSQNTCSDYDQAHCARCFNVQSKYASQMGHVSSICYECAIDKDYYWVEGSCVEVPEARSINGWGRTCAECGKGNFWSSANMKCQPCKYEAAHCPSGKCCNEDEDFECTATFTLNPNTKRCECEKGAHFKVFDKCYCNGQEDVYLVIQDDKSVTCEKCADKCPTGCGDYECGTGFYLDGCECKPVHYSCQDAKSASEENCDTCKAPFEFVEIVSGTMKCLCPCCSMEGGEECSMQDQECLAILSSPTSANVSNNGSSIVPTSDVSPVYGSKYFSQSYFDQLNLWFGNERSYSLIYRLSTDSSSGFASSCMNKGQLLVLVKVDDTRVIGAYTVVEWGNYYINDYNAKLYSLTPGKEQMFDNLNIFQVFSSFYRIGGTDAADNYADWLSLVDTWGSVNFGSSAKSQTIFGNDFGNFKFIDYEIFQVFAIDDQYPQ